MDRFHNYKKNIRKINDIEYHFIGPCELKNKLTEDRIKFHGVINRRSYNYVKHLDCFIMPFKLNKLVKSVDPVKLYEYINYNKPIISVYYEELEYFSKFIHFYYNTKDLINFLKNMTLNKLERKYSSNERVEFLKIHGQLEYPKFTGF